jgi:hypothetical protein
MHDGIFISFIELLHLLGWLIICFKYHIIVDLWHKVFVPTHILIMLTIRQEHAWVLVIATMYLVIERLVDILVRVVFLERRSRLLVTLIPFLFLYPLSDLRYLASPEVQISGRWVILFSGNKYVSHGHSLHQLIHGLHHHVEFIV